MNRNKFIIFFAILCLLFLFLISTRKLNETNRLELKEPQWKFYVLDNKSASRFVDLSYDLNNNPHIFFFAERTREGLKQIYSNNTLEDYYYNDRNWKTESLDNKRESGFFVSSLTVNDTIKLCYMDYEVGNEKLYIASLKGNTFKKKIVDDKTKSGLSAGMYCSLICHENQSYVFYYVEEGKKFVVQDINSKLIKILDYNAGRQISAEHYQDKVYVAYKGRDDMHLRFGIYDLKTQSWSHKKYPINVTSLDLAIFNGSPYITYYNKDDKGIYFTNALNFNPIKIANGFMSVIAMDANHQNLYIAYFIERKGLFLAKTNDGQSFEVQQIDDNPNAGEFLDLKVTPNDDIKIAYLDKTFLRYAEFERSSYLLMRRNKELQTYIYRVSANISLVTLLVLILFLIGPTKIAQQKN